MQLVVNRRPELLLGVGIPGAGGVQEPGDGPGGWVGRVCCERLSRRLRGATAGRVGHDRVVRRVERLDVAPRQRTSSSR